jgi:hypothetical protein
MRISIAGAWLLGTLVLVLGIAASSQDSKSEAGNLAIDVALERKQGDEWRWVDPGTVFHKGQEIRFRFRSSRSGYLYVLNRSSTGESTWLFPRFHESQSGRVEPGPDYLVPGTKGSFVVEGSPGFDITYWILSPIPIDVRETSQPVPGSQPSTLEPRCRTETLKARGLCVDDRAGPGPIREFGDAPLSVLRSGALVSRDLKFHSQDGATRISSGDPQNRTVVYEFRIAHD